MVLVINNEQCLNHTYNVHNIITSYIYILYSTMIRYVHTLHTIYILCTYIWCLNIYYVAYILCNIVSLPGKSAQLHNVLSPYKSHTLIEMFVCSYIKLTFNSYDNHTI